MVTQHGGEDEWRSFGLRDLPEMSGREPAVVPEVLAPLVDERIAGVRQPFVGVTTDGQPRSGLRSVDVPRVDTRPIVDAASAFLESLSPELRARATFPLRAAEWRQWINVHMYYFRHGVMLEDLAPESRELALALLRATLSARGFDQARAILTINGLIADLSGHHESFGEWLYFVSVFGSPGDGEPWGWQIDGHHLCLNVLVLDDRIVATPSFMGSEPRSVREGPHAGLSLFDPEESTGLALVRSLDDDQVTRAVIRPSIRSADLPRSLMNPFDGRMQAGSAHDNAVLPHEGVAGADLSDAQRRLLLELTGAYVGWLADDHAAVRMSEVAAHLDETWFSWSGGTGDDSAFYYRVHSPVILIEFDHHAGVVFDTPEPTRHHVHTLVRTPNGGDYGVDLLDLHYQQFDHGSPRPPGR